MEQLQVSFKLGMIFLFFAFILLSLLFSLDLPIYISSNTFYVSKITFYVKLLFLTNAMFCKEYIEFQPFREEDIGEHLRHVNTT